MPANPSAPPHQSINYTHMPLIFTLITLASKAHTSPHSSVRSRLHVEDSFPTSPMIIPRLFSCVNSLPTSYDFPSCSSCPPSSLCLHYRPASVYMCVLYSSSCSLRQRLTSVSSQYQYFASVTLIIACCAYGVVNKHAVLPSLCSESTSVTVRGVF